MGQHTNEKSGLATAGMVLGIIAIVGAWIPFLNIVSIILGVLALIFGMVPLFQKRSIGKAVTGVVLSLAAIVIAIAMINAASTAIDKVVNGSDASKVGEQNKTAEKTTFAVNDVIAFDDKEVIVSGLERNWTSGNSYSKPESGKEFVKVQVTIKNKSQSQISYNTFDWKMKDSKGDIKDATFETYGIEGALSSGELAAGGEKAGFLVFEVPSNDAGLVLQYNLSFWSDKKLEITL